jgi:hypothetical protein
MTSRDDGHDWEVGGSSMMCITTAMCNDKRPARPPTDHLRSLLEEAYPNNAYPIRHKLKYCSMMRSFMTSGSLT